MSDEETNLMGMTIVVFVVLFIVIYSDSSSSTFLFGLSEMSFIVSVVGGGVGILLICVLVSVCIAVCIRKKRKPKLFER